MSRRLAGLRWARMLSARPSYIPAPKGRRGAKAVGLKYERQIAAALPAAIHNPWFEFEDSNGKGYCSPDFLFSVSDVGLVVLESKYTWTMEGHSQLEELYLQVVESAFSLPAWGMVIARRILPDMTGVKLFCELDNALESAIDGGRVCLHWLGESAIPGWKIARQLEIGELVH
ncbi:MAG TPA: hypothetical protein VJQ25_10975 [Nitrospira sp.]|nr:hypothetical protein [Nitrospira sp.]